MLTFDQIADDFVRKVHEQQDRYARTPGPLLPDIHREIVEGMTIIPRKILFDSGHIPGEPQILRSLVNRYDVSLFSLTTFEFDDDFSDEGDGRIRFATMGSEDVLFDTWRRTIEVRPQATDRTVLLASDQQHLLDLLLFIQRTQIDAAEQMIFSGQIMESEEWILEAGKIGGGEGVVVYFSR